MRSGLSTGESIPHQTRRIGVYSMATSDAAANGDDPRHGMKTPWEWNHLGRTVRYGEKARSWWAHESVSFRERVALFHIDQTISLDTTELPVEDGWGYISGPEMRALEWSEHEERRMAKAAAAPADKPAREKCRAKSKGKRSRNGQCTMWVKDSEEGRLYELCGSHLVHAGRGPVETVTGTIDLSALDLPTPT